MTCPQSVSSHTFPTHPVLNIRLAPFHTSRPPHIRLTLFHAPVPYTVGLPSHNPSPTHLTHFHTTSHTFPHLPHTQLGYNAIQIMAIQEHAYYGSFGYHVTNFFGVSS